MSIGILQARILGWVAMPSSRGSSQPRDQTQVSLAGGFFTSWATRDIPLSWLSWVQFFEIIWTVAHQVPLSMGFFSKNPGVGCHFLLQGIFPIQGCNLPLLHWHVGSLKNHSWIGKILWRREWQPTPGFLPEKSHGRRSLADYSPWGRKELEMT